MNVLDRPVERNIVGFEFIDTKLGRYNANGYEMMQFSQFQKPGTDYPVKATAEEIMLAANILHFLQAAKTDFTEVMLYQEMSTREWWHTAIEDAPIKVEIH